MSSQSTVADTPGKPQTHRTKVLAPLTTSDAFRQDFSRTLPLSANGRFRLHNVNGQVEIAGWDGSDVIIKALKHGRTQKSVDVVKINVDSSLDEIAIHTEQPDGEPGFSGIWSWFKNGGNNSANVDYAIQIPRHTRLANISAVNGRVEIDDVSGDIEVSAVNGEVQIHGAAGSLKLSTVNGRLLAELVSLGRGQSVALNSVNGQIEATLPADANAEVSASTVNGGMTSEFPALVVQKEFPISKKLNGTLGHGGASVKANTVNGAIRFCKGPDSDRSQNQRDQSPQKPEANLPPASPQRLAARYEAARAITAIDKRDAAFAAVARDAATAGDLGLVNKALSQITMYDTRDKATYETAGTLARSGRRADAIDIAKTITSLPTRDAALRELAE